MPATQDGVTICGETQQPMLERNGLDGTLTTDTGDEDIQLEVTVDPSAPPVEEIIDAEGPLPSSPPPPPYDELLELEDLVVNGKFWEDDNDSDELPAYEHVSHIEPRDGLVRISQV